MKYVCSCRGACSVPRGMRGGAELQTAQHRNARTVSRAEGAAQAADVDRRHQVVGSVPGRQPPADRLDGAREELRSASIAAERVQQARAQLGILRANLFPFLNGQAQWNATRASTLGSLPFIAEGTDLKFAYTQAGIGASWELDLWGRLRRLTESARAQYLATEENRLALRCLAGRRRDEHVLHSAGAGSRTRNRTPDQGHRGRRTAARRTTSRSGRRYRTRCPPGGTVALSGDRADRRSAAEYRADRKRSQPAARTDALRHHKGNELRQIPVPAKLPAGLPAALIARRPDMRQAEQVLISANAEIGAARALYFPQISLTAFFGGQSRALRDLFTNAALTGNVAPSAVLPIFHAGQIRNNVRLTEAQQREMLIRYQQTIYGALRDVSDALVAHQRTSRTAGPAAAARDRAGREQPAIEASVRGRTR